MWKSAATRVSSSGPPVRLGNTWCNVKSRTSQKQAGGHMINVACGALLPMRATTRAVVGRVGSLVGRLGPQEINKVVML